MIDKVLKNRALLYDDYPLTKRKYVSVLLAQFMCNKISFEKLCKKFPITSTKVKKFNRLWIIPKCAEESAVKGCGHSWKE